VSDDDVPPPDWIHIPVPAIVEPEVFAAVQEPWQENRQHARQSRRGARYLLQGLLQCQHCGSAFDGKPLSPSTRQGRPRASAYDRCVGMDAYRVGGQRLCPDTQGRTDRLELAVWQDVCALLAHPERLAQEFTRRLHADGQGQRQERTALERQVGKLRRGLAHRIDSYAEGLIEKQAFEPRVTRRRQRMTHVEAQCQQLAEAETLQRELQLIIGRVEELAAQVHQNLEALEWQRKREMIRALGRRVAIGFDQVQVVFRVGAFAGEADPEKKSLQLCKGSEHRTLGYTGFGGMPHLIFHITGFEPLLDQLPREEVANGLHQGGVPDVIECAFDIGISDPWPRGIGPCQAKDFFDRVVTSSARAKPVADPFEPGFPEWFQGVFHHGLHTSIDDGGNAERSCALSLGDVDSTDRVNPMQIECAELTAKRPSFFRWRHDDVIDAGCRLAMVHLGDSAHTLQSVRPTLQPQSLQRSDVLQIAIS
jgi:hypothetical protein